MSLKNKNNFPKVLRIIEDKYLSGYSQEFVNDYIGFFSSRWPDEAEAIIFYGSCLSKTTKEVTSTPDFFLICKSYYSFHKKIIHTLLNMIFSPSLYSINEKGLMGKYNVLSLNNLKRETSSRAKDIYILGRLTKKTAIIYSKNESSLKKIVEFISNGYYTVAEKSLYLIDGEFCLDKFIESAISISYVGEKRIEADDKIIRLKNANADFYKSVYSLIIEDFISSGLLKKNGQNYVLSKPESLKNKFRKFFLKFFLLKSRIRAKLRWPKSIYTFKGWVDVLLAKIERTKGIKIELSEKERKYPLIYGWKYYFKLKRDKLIK